LRDYPALLVYKTGVPCVGGSYNVDPIFDRAKDGILRMLIRRVRPAKPRVIGHIHQKERSVINEPPCHIRKYILKAYQAGKFYIFDKFKPRFVASALSLNEKVEYCIVGACLKITDR